MRRFGAAALLIAVLGLAAVPAAAKTLVFCSEADPGGLNPETASSDTSVVAVQPMFNGLVQLSPQGGDVVPSLAESWDISPDGTDYLFHLRRGVRFHSSARFTPTRTLNADDVLFSFNRQRRADHPFHHPASGQFDYFDDMEMPRLLKSIERVDDYTVRFRLTHAEAPFLADLAMPFAMILSAEYADAMLKAGTPEILDLEPVGTGPFAFEGYRKDVSIRYSAFADHWGGRPPIDTLVFSITPNASVRLNKLRAGECQVMSFPSPADVDKIEADPRLRLLRQEGLNIGYLAMNTSRPPFDDVRVRRAINMAIDKDTLVRVVYGRGGTPAANPLPPTIWSANEAVKPYPYDVSEAQKLVAEAGLAGGVEIDLWYMPITRAYNPDSKRIGEMVADDLARIGVRAHLMSAPWTDYRRKIMGGELPMAFYGWTSDNGDPDNILGMLLGCHDGQPNANNVAKWCDPEYNLLLERARTTTDHAERDRLYRQAQLIVHDQAPWFPLAHGLVLSAVHKDVKGVTLDSFGRNIFDKVDLRPD